MFSRIRNAVGLGLLLALLTFLTVYAKGEFSFITITGPGIEEIRSTDLNLTSDYFAFAEFSGNGMKAPSDPGDGYVITRYYRDGTNESAFDQLHYYPETGFVFYDGIVNGESEYDGKWYSANPAIKSIFESALLAAPVAKAAPEQTSGQMQPQTVVPRVQPPMKNSLSQFSLPAAILTGLVILLIFIVWQRKLSAP